MSILLDGKTPVVVQGITGRVGRAQTHWMLDYGTNIVAGVTPGRGGMEVEGVPVFDTVREAREKRGAQASVFFVPAAAVAETLYETIDAGIELIVVVTEHIPVHDVMRLRHYARQKRCTVLGPTTPGILTPGEAKMGIMPGALFSRGPVGIVSRSGTLSYEIGGNLRSAGIGQSTVVGMGADPVVFTNLPEILSLFQADTETRIIVVVGEVGGVQEEMAAEFIRDHVSKPVVAYIAGRHTPEGKRMGHAGALIQRGMGNARSKIEALTRAGVAVSETPAGVVDIVRKLL
ncbi:MAG: succinate--CoA ligase subunit alpha [Deltaproteobacteria bacterium]|nr:succinate--CoA ligase subunit alpha [Deltaproteobacteria bacterium]MBW2305483.1 succinate--CoA ligase subunit alpha [Deltaproteobacteria bacterium]